MSFAEMIAPMPVKGKGKSKDKAKGDGEEKPKEAKGPPLFASKIVFAEPEASAKIHLDVLKREPQGVDLSRVLRTTPMMRGRGAYERPTLDFSRPLFAQEPPICFVH